MPHRCSSKYTGDPDIHIVIGKQVGRNPDKTNRIEILYSELDITLPKSSQINVGTDNWEISGLWKCPNTEDKKKILKRQFK